MAKRKNLALRKNKSEVIAMSIFEYDKEEEERKLRKAEAAESGIRSWKRRRNKRRNKRHCQKHASGRRADGENSQIYRMYGSGVGKICSGTA